MPSSRDAFLERVRDAVAAGNRAGQAAPLQARGTVGYQGAGADPVAKFAQEFRAAGGETHVVPNAEAAARWILDWVRERKPDRALLGRGSVIDSLALTGPLSELGVDCTPIDTIEPEAARDTFFAADLGISGVHALIAETGSIVVSAAPTEPRSLTLLPPVHIAVAHRGQVIPDLFDLFEPANTLVLPSCLTLITGPSKTGDIELRLVTGVHGPGEVHVVLIDDAAPAR